MIESLNPQQKEAVLRTEGPLLVIAGAGSGKTRVLTTRIAHLIQDKGVQPDGILAFTFTNKAAREMRERVQGQATASAQRCWIGTFHATGVRILRREARRLDYPNNFTIYDTDDSVALLREILRDRKADPKLFTPKGVLSEVSRFKNDFVRPDLAKERALTARDEQLADIYRDYDLALRKNAAMDFDDLIGRTVELFENHRDVQERYSSRFDYVLVDEFQDTNPMQLVMIRALSAVHGNLFAVGDDDQSIYSWRGATVDNMLNFEEYFPGAGLIRLEQNYRSTSLILKAANEVIAHNRRRKGKNLWSDIEGGDPIELMWADDGDDEASRIRDRIRDHLAEGKARKDMVILYRTNAQSRSLEDALRREGIPYQIVGGTRFFDRREVRDLMAYLKVLVNPQDTVSFQRILNVPRRGIGKTSAEKLLVAAAAHGMGPVALCQDPARVAAAVGKAAARRVVEFGQLLRQLTQLAESKDSAAVLKQLIGAVEYEEWLKKDDPGTARERWENVVELLNAAHAFVGESDEGRLSDFVESVALLADMDSLEDTDDVVTLMTMHNAKGLEFPVVFVSGCEEGLLPHATSMMEDDGVEEERRLFYVALTRAERRLHIGCAGSRQRFGRWEPMLPSRFLSELPEDCVVEIGSKPREEERVERSWGDRPARSRTPWLDKPSAAPAKRRKRRAAPTGDKELLEGNFGAETFLRSRGRTTDTGFDDHEFSQEEVHFAAGLRVQHEMLGEGTIQRVEGIGDLMRLTIDFGEAGTKKVLAKYARLRVLDEGQS